jgi:hypothetical protein
MKNLMIYISPTGSFNNPRPDLTSNDAEQLVKVQIENSLELGWKKEDILLFTNFPYEYAEIKSKVLKDVEFFNRKPQASKINAINKLFEDKIIKKNEIYWFHDLDAYQLEPISQNEIDLSNADLALTDYGGTKFGGIDKWHTASFFFNASSNDIFEKIKEVMYQKNTDEEKALSILTITNKKITKRIKKLNNTYNFNGFYLQTSYKKVNKPIKVVHFHPYGYIKQLKVEKPLNFFRGENVLHIPLITRSLIKRFKYHRIG